MRTLAVLALVSILAACGGGQGATPAPGTPTSESKPAGGDKAVKAPGDAQVGDTTRCPVSGEELVVAADTPHVEYKGKTYYTCCAGCKKKLEADPEKYLNKKN